MKPVYSWLLYFLLELLSGTNGTKPNIILIIADDFGWNDVSWHDPNMHTPNIASLAFHHGIILNQSYVNELCSPTRSALFTGYYPFHMGTQNGVFHACEPSGVPLKFKFFPEYLQKLNYRTHMVGKWHVGYCNTSYIPFGRGFDSFYGYYMGMEDYYTHMVGINEEYSGYDFWDGARPDFTKKGVYSTVPNKYLAPCRQTRKDRRLYCGMVNAMDIAVGRVVDTLKNQGLYENTVIIFSADNGGQTLYGGNNYPLRGNKNTLWEGGTRAISFIHSPKFRARTPPRTGLFQIVDWFPTILGLAGKSIRSHGDGFNQWDMIRHGKSSKRSMVVYKIFRKKGSAFRLGRYKLIVGVPGTPDGWIPPTRKIDPGPPLSSSVYLFDLKNDPTEHKNLAKQRPRILKKMLKILRKLGKEEAKGIHLPTDPMGDPAKYNGTFATGWCH